MKLYRTRFCILHFTKFALSNTVRKPTPPFTNSATSIFNARSISQYSSNPNGSSSRAYKKRVNRRLREASKPVLDEARFNKAKSLLPPRFTADHLHDIVVQEEDPLVCYELFNWAFRQPRFRHNVNSYHITIKKLGAAQMYEEMDAVVNHILAVPHIGSEALYNTMIYYYTEVRKLTRSVIVFKHMKDCRNLECRPSIKTYNLMFAAFLSRRNNTHVSHMYMETMSCLFRQMIGDGVEPNIFTLNCMIKGYVMSNHVNDGLRIFHQVEAVYKCQPNAASYDCLVHGLCAQGRTRNAKALCEEMQEKGFVLSARTYNSLVNALSLNGEVEEAVQHLSEMMEKKKTADFITYKTVLDQLCREGKIRDAKCLLEEVKERRAVDASSYKKLLAVLEDDFAYGRDHRSARRLGRAELDSGGDRTTNAEDDCEDRGRSIRRLSFIEREQQSKGKDQWEKTNQPPLDPPKLIVQPGRPKKKRRKEAGEGESKKVSRVRHGKNKCSNCGQEGHTKKSCKNTYKPPEPKRTTNTGRPVSQSTQSFHPQKRHYSKRKPKTPQPEHGGISPSVEQVQIENDPDVQAMIEMAIVHEENSDVVNFTQQSQTSVNLERSSAHTTTPQTQQSQSERTSLPRMKSIGLKKSPIKRVTRSSSMMGTMGSRK